MITVAIICVSAIIAIYIIAIFTYRCHICTRAIHELAREFRINDPHRVDLYPENYNRYVAEVVSQARRSFDALGE